MTKLSNAAPTASNMSESESLPSEVTDEDYDHEMNAAPLHLHAMRVPARLQGSSQHSLKIIRSRSSSRSRSRSRATSRDASPSPSDNLPGVVLSRPSSATSSITGDLESSITAGGVQINIDPDILLDRMAMEDSSSTMNDSFGSMSMLPCLNERMSEESLEDCHAFTDLRNMIRQIPGAGGSGSDPARSRDGSVAGGSILGDPSGLLETLKEFEEESEDGDDDQKKEEESTDMGLKIKRKSTVNDLGVELNDIEGEYA